MRKAAAEGFAESVNRFGTLLTTTEILAQYNRYNESEGEGAESQEVLSMVLDAIEAKAKADYIFKINDRVKILDGTTTGTIDKIEKNIATVNFGFLTTKTNVSKLEIVQTAKK